MAMASSSSFSNTSEWVYDVFLSFRGEDTRINFTDHLYAALNRAGIRTFRDDNELERGEEIGPDLLKSIEKSRFSIIVFSKNYASSTWCLDELVHIMNCRKTRGHIVLPVFYDIEPWAVRKQKRSFEEAFAGHEECFKDHKEKLQRWRSALQEAADLNGYDVQNDADRHESRIIDNIIEDISNKLRPRRLKVAINPVGIHSRANEVKSLLYDESVDVHIVGIYGMGGIGKTTIAKEVYNSIILEFEGSSFLEKVREKFNSSNPNGIIDLQNQLLYDILKGKHEKISNSDRGLKVIEERLHSIKVLIVLDDVDKSEQINKILGNLCDWLSKGSRIIITTRIMDLLPSRVYKQHELDELNKSESLRLFSVNAFGEWHPVEEYSKCSKGFVNYCGGIPLALIVLGSSLFGQSVDVWESKLEKLEKTLDAGIQDVLEISYDSLDEEEREIFLDLACFFIGKDKDYIISILDGCDFSALVGINALIRRCLVKIEYPNKLAMHDLIRHMGRKIVFKECPKECGKRSRVWHHKEAFNLLRDRKGTEAVEGLSLNVPRSGKISTKAFCKMKNLRLLQLNSVNLFGSYKHISKELRWLYWSEFPLESIPNDLHMGNLVSLDLPYNSLKQVWEEEKFLEKLKFLNLSHSQKLKETPNFEGLPNLEILILKDCPILVEVHESIGLLTKLVTLNLKDCRNLENLPRSICMLRSVKNLNVSGCSKIANLPEKFGNMKSLVEFTANGTALRRVPKTFTDLKNLTSLNLSSCLLNLSGFLPGGLRKLELRDCNLSDDMLPNYLQNLPSLEHLDLSGNCFSSLSPTLTLLPQLYFLSLNECRRLKSLPELPLSLRVLNVSNCLELERMNQAKRKCLITSDGCCNLVQLNDDFKVKPTRVEIVKKLLELNCLSIEESIANVRLCMINNRTDTVTSRISPLQGVSENGIYSLFLPGSEIPSCYRHRSEGNSVSFNVPPLQDCKILGFIICVVYARSEISNSFPKNLSPWIGIVNETKRIEWIYNPTVFCLNEAQEDIMWLSYWSFENITMEDSGNWRFKNEMEEGDEVNVLICIGSRILVKKCSVDLLYQPNYYQVASQINEPTTIPPHASKHHRSSWEYYGANRMVLHIGFKFLQ